MIPGIRKSRLVILSKFQGTYMIDSHFKSLSWREITNSKLRRVGDYSAHKTTKKIEKIVVHHIAPPCTSVKNPMTFLRNLLSLSIPSLLLKLHKETNEQTNQKLQGDA